MTEDKVPYNVKVITVIPYENWHKHSKYSNVFTPDSILSIEDLAKRAVELGQKTLSTVEHGYAGNIFEYKDVADKYGLKLVFGVEFYYVKDRFEKDRTNSHLLIMAKNDNGRKALTRLISEANETGYYYKPRIDESLLFSLNPKDVVVTSTCIASPYNLYDDYECFITQCHDYFKENFFLEIHDNTNWKQVEFNKKIKKLNEKYNIPYVFATDTHYIHPEDSVYRDDLLRGKGIFYDEEEGFIMDYPTAETALERFEEQGVFTREEVLSAFENTLIARDFEELNINKDIKMPTLYPDKTHEEKIKILKKIVNNAWIEDRKHIKKERHKEYLEAIKFEMSIIENTKMEDYFLLNYEVIKRAKELGGILTRTGRGSAPSFYLNKLLGFTEVDRLDAPIELFPTRFMSESRILQTVSLPDIDFNCADPKPFIQATRELLGEHNCYYMTAFGTMQESEALRNLGRSREIPASEINDVAKDVDSYRKNAKWSPLIEESSNFIGTIDSVSPHPCACLLMTEDVREEVGVIRVGDELCAVIDSYYSDVFKFLKNDYLSVTVWKIIGQAFEKTGMEIPDVRELSKLVESDEKVWDLYKDGIVATLNQAGTASGKPQVMQYSPRSVRELSGWVSAIRPSFSSMKAYFLNREPFSYGIPTFDKILESSDNFVLYQENIMSALVYVGFPEDETYGLLKAIAKKKEGIIEPIHDKFIDGFKKRVIEEDGTEEDIAEEQALKVWKIIEDAVGYGFNSSHAYSVALDSIYGAYLKANYPLEYYATVLEIYQGNTDKTGEIVKELPYFDIELKNIEYGKSAGSYQADSETNSVYKGIASIKFLNKKIGDDFLEISKNEELSNLSWVEFCQYILDNKVAQSNQMEILIRLDFFKKFGEKEVLLELYLVMTDKKKVNLIHYPEFAPKNIKIEKRNKQKEIRYEDKVIKKPLKYESKHSDKTKEERLKNLKEFYDILLERPPKKISLYEQVSFEKEFLGYAYSTWEHLSPKICLVLDINKKYTPLITMYQVSTGKEFLMKVKKKNFWMEDESQMLYEGDVIQATNVTQEEGWKQVDGKWERNPNKLELHLNQCSLIRKSPMRNKLTK